MISNKTFLLLFVLTFSIHLTGQEILTGLQYNDAVDNSYQKILNNLQLKSDLRTNDLPLVLPFFDDFETSNIFPNADVWKGKAVFINENFPFFPPNINAATFDALDSTGKVYKNAEWIPFQADILTSQPLRLDSVFSPLIKELSPKDSLYFSFFYQPQGYGDAPENWDTLMLEFSSFGANEFKKIDSVLVFGYEYLASELDTIRPGDTLFAPPGCNPDIFTIVYQNYSYYDQFPVACDSVFGPSTVWNRIWDANGMKLDTFRLKNEGKDFVQVMIPITDLKYFHNAFQFRFRNYASIANDIIPSWRSNADQWSVDFIYLNYNRNIGDTTYRRLTFSNRATSFLKNYQVMPYRQYRADAAINTMRLDFPMYISNMDNIEHNTNYKYTVQQVNGDFGFTYNGGNCNLPPFFESGFQSCVSCQKHACPPVQSAFNYDFSRDTTSYIINHYISDSSDANKIVDSASYTQGFYNYYAYDDGTPEFGYGLEPAGAQLAYQFKLSVADTLRGVQMYFNRVVEDANVNYFDLVVWKDNNGKPGEVAYVFSAQKPQWVDGLFHFYTYEFENPLILSGTFYVGWQQLASGSLNLGFDANNNSQNRIFYKIEQSWVNSNYEGSLLIRPIIGQNLILGVVEPGMEPISKKINLYPNPASTYFTFDSKIINPNSEATVYIYNVYGSLVSHLKIDTPRVSIESLNPGMYLVRIISSNHIFTGKLIIQH